MLRLVYGLLCGVDVNRNVVSFKTHARFLRRYKATAGTDHHTDTRARRAAGISAYCAISLARRSADRARARENQTLLGAAREGGALELSALSALSLNQKETNNSTKNKNSPWMELHTVHTKQSKAPRSTTLSSHSLLKAVALHS